uniref:uncharacterized protein LOC122604320 n=1 Tax=Erigeron canadensis TaxID=72917 RepID=UPI001CB8B76A|nr:uncharacterized protein LOC122604320 [Erigeron canadensis]
MLQLRHRITPFVWSKLGDGKDTSIWFDRWAEQCPLSPMISDRQIVRAGFSLDSRVADLCYNGVWNWPDQWRSDYPILNRIPGPMLQSDIKDELGWVDVAGIVTDYSSKACWDTIRVRQAEVPWTHVIWFSQSIPRHAFLVWLIVRKKLKTQDMLMQWNKNGNANFNLM